MGTSRVALRLAMFPFEKPDGTLGNICLTYTNKFAICLTYTNKFAIMVVLVEILLEKVVKRIAQGRAP